MAGQGQDKGSTACPCWDVNLSGLLDATRRNVDLNLDPEEGTVQVTMPLPCPLSAAPPPYVDPTLAPGFHLGHHLYA